MKTQKRKFGLFGVVAFTAILAVAVAANIGTQDVIAEQLPAKKGYTGNNDFEAFSEEFTADTDGYVVIDPFYFKSNNGGDVKFDLTAECGTATHIQGKSSKQNIWEGASVDAKVWFEVSYDGLEADDPNKDWKRVPLKGSAYTANVEDDTGKWNFCSQTFEIKTNLNAVVEETILASGETALVFACDINDPNYTFDPECEQFIDLFLLNAGTHPATAVLTDIPNGVHLGRVMADVTIVDQDSLEETGAVGDGEHNTMLTLGQRLLTVEDIQILDAHDQN